MKYRKLIGYKYQIVEPFSIRLGGGFDNIVAFAGNNFISLWEGKLSLSKGYAWDGPSGPTFDTANFMTGSLVHDALYQLMKEGLLDLSFRIHADRELRRICLEAGMSRLRAWYVYQAVRIFGGAGMKKKKTAEVIEV